jgi:Putative metallopeptidase
MKPILTVVPLVSLIAAYAVAPAVAQTSVAQNPQIRIQYAAPKFLALAERLQKRGVLEEYSQFMSPLRLKAPLSISTEECGTVNSDYNPDTHQIRLCYELLDLIENEAAVPQAKLPPPYNDPKKYPGLGLMPGYSPAEVIVGGIIQVTLHETGHAVFDIQGIPRLGREEDAADEISGLVMLQFGKSLSRTLIRGTIDVWNYMQGKYGFNERASLGDVHSLSIERAVNYLCLAYGQDAASFEDLASQWIPKQRRDNCKYEYDSAFLAFKKTVLPFVDMEQLRKVQAMPLLRPDDSKL